MLTLSLQKYKRQEWKKMKEHRKDKWQGKDIKTVVLTKPIKYVVITISYVIRIQCVGLYITINGYWWVRLKTGKFPLLKKKQEFEVRQNCKWILWETWDEYGFWSSIFLYVTIDPLLFNRPYKDMIELTICKIFASIYIHLFNVMTIRAHDVNLILFKSLNCKWAAFYGCVYVDTVCIINYVMYTVVRWKKIIIRCSTNIMCNRFES